VGPVQVAPVASARDLGVYFESDMTMKTHVTRLVSSCFGILRQIHSIRRSLPRSTLTMLISSFIMSKLDYCNVALVGLTRCDLDRLQSVINAAARLTVGAQHYDHISPLLVDLHWLRMAERIQYKLCTCIPLPTWISTMLPSTDSLSSGEHGITASSAVSHTIRPDGACYTKVNTGWPCLRCSRTTGLKQPSGRHPSLSIIANFQTFTQVPPFSSVFLFSISFIIFM